MKNRSNEIRSNEIRIRQELPVLQRQSTNPRKSFKESSSRSQFAFRFMFVGKKAKRLSKGWDNFYKCILCLVLLQVPKCFVPVQIFWDSPKIWLHLVPLQKLLCRHKKTNFVNGNHLLARHKKLGPAQKLLGPIEGQDINYRIPIYSGIFDQTIPIWLWQKIARYPMMKTMEDV